jgi:hypothetical protein
MADAVDDFFEILTECDIENPTEREIAKLAEAIKDFVSNYSLRAKFVKRFKEINDLELKQYIIESFNFVISLSEKEAAGETTATEIAKAVMERGGLALAVTAAAAIIIGQALAAVVALFLGLTIAVVAYQLYAARREVEGERKRFNADLKSLVARIYSEM